MKKLYYFIACVLLVWSCTNAGDKVNKDQATAADNTDPLKDEFDNLEAVFQSSTWQQVVSGDTSYFLFSRQAHNHYKIYNYRVINGDSANTDIAEIKAKDNKVIWEWRNMPAELVSADASSNSWILHLPDSSVANFKIEKLDSMHLRWEFPDRAVTLTRLQSFLPSK